MSTIAKLMLAAAQGIAGFAILADAFSQSVNGCNSTLIDAQHNGAFMGIIGIACIVTSAFLVEAA